MGCESSQADKPLGIRINILDSNFSKSDNSKARQRMNQLAIRHEVYLSMACLVQDMLKVYTNELIATEDFIPQLLKELERTHFRPNIYVLKTSNANPPIQTNSKFPISHFSSYDQIITELTDKTHRKRKSNLNPAFQKNKKHLVLKIFRKKNNNSSEQMIFEQTLKSKNISYEIYQTFSQFEESLDKKTSNFIVTDYLYHREVINLVENTPTRVICFCDFEREETYDLRTYFITNNFLEIVSEIVSEQKVAKMNFVRCSKAYIYSSQVDSLSQYVDTIEHFDLQVKINSDLKAIIRESKYFFALTLIINPEERKEVESILQSNDYLFKTKIIEIKKGTENTVKGLRKVIKQVKKGYRASKGLTKTIDIIDKHFDNVKFDTIKKQLQKFDIKCYGYHNLSEYIKKKKFMSPFIICNFEQNSLVLRYAREIKSQSKIILFCNKNHITPQLKQSKGFAFVSSHFGKIINFIKKNTVYNPYILDENEVQIRNKKEKLNRNNKRISALNWSGGVELLKKEGEQAMGEMQKKFEFLNVNQGTQQAEIFTIQKEFASLFSLQYLALDCPQRLKQNFISSLRKLRTLLKINYPQGEFQKLVTEVQQFNTVETMTRIMSFFSSQNEMGFKINKSLINVESLEKEEILCLKEYMLYVNMNFLTVYRDSFVGRIKLHHYLKSELIQKCQIGSSILNKNYCIFYQSDDSHSSTNQQSITPYRIQLQLEIDPTTQSNPFFNSYFRYNQKFIFSPYSQFEIKSIFKNQGETVVVVEYKQNVDYLKYYFAENLHKQKANLLALCEQELDKFKTTTEKSFLFDQTTKDSFSRSLLRVKALNFYHSDNVEQAIKYQKELIIREEGLQNFDSAKLQWLNYQLACYQLKNQNNPECKRLLKEMMQTEPNDFLRERIIHLSRNFRKSTQDSIIPPVAEIIQVAETNSKKDSSTNLKTIELNDRNDDNESEDSQERNIFDFQQYNHEVQCLDFEMLENFENDQKENIA